MPATPEEHAGTDAAPNGTSATAPAAANEAAAIDEDALERKVSQFNSVHSGLEVDHAGDESLEKVSSKKLAKDAFDVENLGDELRALSERHSVEEVRVLSRLMSADHNLAPPKPPATCNPLLLAWRWWVAFLLPGMGMFSEAYFIFAIGNIEPLLAIQYPNCFGDEEPPDCNQTTENNIQNIEISAIIVGMLTFGFIADVIGRKWGSRFTMAIMFVGACLLTGAYGPNAQVFLSVFCFSLFFYACGVGGEYPLSSSSAAERAEADPELRHRRGEVILLLLAMLGATETVSAHDAELTWRLQFGVGAVICFVVTAYRWLYLEESEVWKAEHESVQKELVEEQDEAALAGKRSWREHLVIFKFYWPRLFITCMGWVADDFAFYGNKLFQSQFIAVISPGASRFVSMQWTLLNSGVSLCGYYAAAYTIDKKWMGRKRLQAMGFLMMFFLFIACGIFYNQLLDNAIQVFQTLYFLSSFFNQFGPNCTSFLVAGEVYPTDVRAFFHGISASAGKLGAILAASVFSNVSTVATFYASAGAGIVGAVITWVFLPDTTGLELAEIDRLHRYMLAGQIQNYHGPATNPKHLSLYERWRGYGEYYNPREDALQHRLQELAKNH
ncbi:hypothetical protein CHLNCDRAFT_59145 [Chlorella variabilis]|uniref:Major facilitator superfamily (MFS) profile domain-containing protein n=1 Tax=Chlorella variabilis TaxID=554065 RepID=E1ZR25_CHLVA|nr:hypothetical protein CHLNCDRAFT_59145 [Chlorella variabilis]EFN51657.1 hypothetical protein CHLNCDRAFT_59145 [Chlorella variabilis]|eukprot:XP_005843759.1 hypothetical protein CHLNCDRAFT_59145 [Chlorella variabilis]